MITVYSCSRQLVTFAGPKGPRRGDAMKDIGVIRNGAILVKDGIIISVGPKAKVMRHRLAAKAKSVVEMDGICLPGFVDSHTHALFAEPRLRDFSLRTSGVPYGKIKEMGGGIVSGIASVRKMSPEAMTGQLCRMARRFLENGTTTAEVKTGYGLDKSSEIRMLKAINEANKLTPCDMVPTLLAAHSVPPEFKGDGRKYLEYVEKEILPEAAKNRLARFTDIFCEEGFFTPEQTKVYLAMAGRLGLIPKAHAEQMKHYGGIRAAVEAGALTVDHADYADASDIAAMKAAGTIATLLPASNYFLGLDRYPDARALISAGVPVAIATDFNPGTSPCWNMQFVLSAACTHCGFTPEEALTAAITNGAAALKSDVRGTLEEGKKADFVFYEADDYRELCYYFGVNHCLLTVKDGNIVYSRRRKYPARNDRGVIIQ